MRIRIVSPSGLIAGDLLAQGVANLTAAGHDVSIARHVTGFQQSVFSAPDECRAMDLYEALTDPDVDVVWCARGGYGAMRTLEALESIVPSGSWQSFFASVTKPIVGFSDITILHAAAERAGRCGILGPMLKHIASHGIASPDVQATFNLLQGKEVSLSRPALPGSVCGLAQGKLIGGNLSILYSMASTPLMPSPDGAILFIEDLCEYNYHIDRMIRALRFSGFLSRLSGLIVGQMTDMRDGATPFGSNAYQIIADAVADYAYPLFLGYPSGHASSENHPLLIGAQARLSVTNSCATLTQNI